MTEKDILEGEMRNFLRPPPFKFKPYQNRLEKACFFIMIAAFVGAVLFGGLFRITQCRWMITFTLGSLVVLQVSSLLYALAPLISSVRIVFSIEKNVLEPVMNSFDEHLALIARLVQTLERNHLEYALDRMTLVVEQLRSRLALIVGALDKIGMIPLAASLGFSVYKLIGDSQLTPAALSWLIAISISLTFIYLMTLALLRRYQRFDDLCLVLKHAVQAKKLATPSLNADAPAVSRLNSPSG